MSRSTLPTEARKRRPANGSGARLEWVAQISRPTAGNTGRTARAARMAGVTLHASTSASPRPCCTKAHAVTGECTSMAGAPLSPKKPASARPSGVSGRIADPRAAGEILRRHHLAACQRMVRRQDAQHRLAPEQRGRQRRMPRRHHRHADIGPTAQENADQFVEGDAAVVDARGHAARAQPRQRTRHQLLREGGAGHHAQRAGAFAAQRRGQVVDALYAAVDLLDLGKQAPRFRCRQQLAARALEQGVAEPAFGQRQHPADRGLRHMQHASGPADRARQHDGLEHLDLAQVERPARWRSRPCSRALACACQCVRPSALPHASPPKTPYTNNSDYGGSTLFDDGF